VQNRIARSTGAPHALQTPLSAPPQPPQKREAAEFSVPHVGQSMDERAYSPPPRSTKHSSGSRPVYRNGSWQVLAEPGCAV
jgi:hypothetical protein